MTPTEGQTTTEAKEIPDRLATAISGARESFQALHGNCSMCAVGDVPIRGLHRDEHKCGNATACLLCINAGMECGDQCAACGRVQISEATP